LAFHSSQVSIEAVDLRSLLLDPRSLLFGKGGELINDFRLPPDDGMARNANKESTKFWS